MTDKNTSLLLFWLFVLCYVGAQVATAAEMQLFSGESFEGKPGYAKGVFSSGSRKVPAGDVLLLNMGSTGTSGEEQSRVSLGSGDVFAAQLQSGILRDDVTLIRSDGQKIKFPLKQVLSVQINPTERGAVIDTSISGSHVRMVNGKALACDINWITPQEVGIKTSAGSLRLQRAQVSRLIFNSKAESKKVASVAGGWDCRIISRAGDDFSACLLSIGDKSLKANAICGELSLNLDDVFCLQSRSKKIIPLTDLRPASAKTIPYIDFVRKPRINQGLLGGPLSCGGIQWRYGLATHSRTEISYDLNKKYSLFCSFVGIHKISDSAVKAEAIVEGDNEVLTRVKLEAGLAMHYLAVNVSGAQSLKLVFDYGPDGSRGDHGVWGVPLLVKGGAKAPAGKAAKEKAAKKNR